VLDRLCTLAGTGAGAVRAVRDTQALRPMRPDRAVRLPLQYLRYGVTPATLSAMSALRWPDRAALIDERGELSYRELERQAAALATALDAMDVSGAIGVLCRNHRGFVQALLAGSRLGTDVVLLNTDFSGKQLGAVLDRERVGLLIHDLEFDEVVADSGFGGTRVLGWADRPAEAVTVSGLVEMTAPKALRPARPSRVIILTSGTTGTPKGAQHELSLPALVPVALSHMMRVPLRSGDPVVMGPPLFHVLGLAYLSVGLALGAPVVLSRRFDPKEMLDSIARHRAQGLVAVPVMLRRILEVPDRPDTSSLRVVLSGGSALHPHLSEAFMDAFGDVLINLYGATETGWATIATPADLRAAPGTVGRPSFRLTIKILDPDGRELPAGATGEIYTGGGLRFAGYTGGGGKRRYGDLLGTGDLGHFDAAGRLFIDGRADDMIVSGGENVFPGEVEDLLTGHAGVADVAVTGVEDAEFGQRLAAYVVRTAGSTVTEHELKNYVREHLARYKVPRDVHFVDGLPRTSSGKVKTAALPAGTP
jgi:acyl-CoA synthetase (AMP-forming)/AMP-acid ligase II